MNRARIIPLASYRPDRVQAAKGVVLRADRMSLIDEPQRRAILDLAWQVLREDRDQRHPPTAPVQAAPLPDAAADPDKVITLAKARQQRRARSHAMTLGPHPTPRRPRITVRPADPSDPQDAA
jgi:hypothetical protein